MTCQPIYDSRDARYKTPYGAVAAGTVVQFTLRPPRAAGFSMFLTLSPNHCMIRKSIFVENIEAGGAVPCR